MEPLHMPPELLNVIIALSIIVGAVQCFSGYRIFKFILGLVGFFVGGALGYRIGYAISQEVLVSIIAGLVGGIAGAVLLVLFYFVGVFVVGALLGGLLGAVLSEGNMAVSLILGVTAGVAALFFQKFMIIVSTAFSGAWSCVTGIAYFVAGAGGPINPANPENLFASMGALQIAILVSWIALGVGGVIVQYKTAPHEEERTSAADK